MAIPVTLQQRLDHAINVLHAHPEHQLEDSIRCNIYDLLLTFPHGQITCIWLAILAAEYVEPLYREIISAHEFPPTREATEEEELGGEQWIANMLADGNIAANEWLVPFEDQVRRIIEVAKGVLVGTITREYAQAAASDAFYYYGIYYGELFDGPMPAPAYHASEAAEQALYVVLERPERHLQGASCNHIDDVVVEAARALSDNRLAFWEWWLTQAIHEAWARAAG